jgi:hypothetical protein
MLAFCRKQMRQSPNLRSTLRGRPQIWQRRTVRVMNFGFLAALIRIARVAINLPGGSGDHEVPRLSCYLANGMPSSAKSALARSSCPAVVTIVTFKPFDLSVFA